MSFVPIINPEYIAWVELSEEQKEKVLLSLGCTIEEIKEMDDKEKWEKIKPHLKYSRILPFIM